jgi:MFS family permease
MNQTARRITRYAWFVVALLWPVALLNYLDRQMLAAMKLSVTRDIQGMGLEANWGFLLGSFKWVYAGLSPIGGYIADRFSRRYAIAGSLFVWSAITWATGHVGTYEQLVAARALMGISEAFYIPAALAMITDYHPGSTRSRAVGLHQMGIYTGVILGGFSGYFADNTNLGWRFAFTACGSVGALYAIPLWFLLKNPARSAQEAPSAGRTSPATAIRDLLSNTSFILLVLCFTLPALAGWIVRDWMPAILQKQFNLSQGHAGVSATLYWQLGALVGAVFGGWLADHWVRRTPRGRIYVSALGMGLLIPAIFGLGNAGALAGAVIFLALFGLGWGFFDCNNMPILCQIVRPELRATGYGIMNFVSIGCGGFADWGFGTLQDHHVPLNVIFGVFAAAVIVSVGLMLLIRPKPVTTVLKKPEPSVKSPYSA